MAANQAQRDRWNAESQVTTWPRRERITKPVTPLLLDALALRSGESVLDVGCGGGLSAMDAARAVAPTGKVTGFDLSGPLVRLATQRAKEAHIENVRFVAGDAQTDAIPGGQFDAVMSQFGVMFFADPVAAFSNVRKHLRTGARMAFVCWQPAAKNVWYPGPVLAKYAPPPAPTEHGGPPPGPFAFGDSAYVKGVLADAGFQDVTFQEFTLDVAVAEDSILDRETAEGLQLDTERTAQAWADLQAFRAPMVKDDGLLHLTLAPQIVRARNPG
jgi:SAM-dependent methyltransferase